MMDYTTGTGSHTLVTGASGFLGGRLLEALSGKGFRVRALYNSSKPTPQAQALPGVHWQQADLLDVYDTARIMEGITHVFHCAAIVSFDPARRRQLLEENTHSTAHVADAALEAGVQKLVHVSSVASLGRNAATSLITEEEQWEESSRASTYAQSKWMAEMEVWRAMGEGLNAVIVNPGIILGAPARFAPAAVWTKGSARLLHVADSGFPFYTTGVTSFVDVADVAAAMLALMDSSLTGERFILSAGDFSFRQVFSEMAAALGKKPPRYKAGAFLSGVVWRAGALKKAFTGQAGSVTRETAYAARQQSFYSNEKLLKALPGLQYTALADTVEDMAAAYRRHFHER